MTDLIGTDVDVYWNLHKKVWSVRDRKTRRVIAHLDGMVLSDVTFRVSAAGNARVRSEGRKNVHAFARGTVVQARPAVWKPGTLAVTYNPYRHTTFVLRDTNMPIHHASRAWLNGRTVMVDIVPRVVVR